MRWFVLHCRNILQDVPCFLVENPKYTEDVKQIDNIYTEIPSPFPEENSNENVRTMLPHYRKFRFSIDDWQKISVVRLHLLY